MDCLIRPSLHDLSTCDTLLSVVDVGYRGVRPNLVVRDGLGTKAGLSEWTGNDVNDKVRQAKVEGSGLWGQAISVGRKITLLILTYDLALESKERLQQRGRLEGLLHVLIWAIRGNITELSCAAASA
jgi:hypothetical protein